jgi:hypothetical protein
VPEGLPFRTVLIGLILPPYTGKSANINEAWETLFITLSSGSKALKRRNTGESHDSTGNRERFGTIS